MIDLERQTHYDTEVWTEVVMDKLRKEKCLCLNCVSITSCKVAAGLYIICRHDNLALAVTRCPIFVDNVLYTNKDLLHAPKE